MTKQKFGGAWTQEKLNVFTSYLEAYLTALKKQKFRKIYIDAFAGTGKIKIGNGEKYLEGSARRALEAEQKFDCYYFIEKDLEKAAELQHMIDIDFPQMKQIIKIYQGDANEQLAQIIDDIDWHSNRALLFLDPYATQVNWTTLETVQLLNLLTCGICSRFLL